jgi:hypothetical protein
LISKYQKKKGTGATMVLSSPLVVSGLVAVTAGIGLRISFKRNQKKEMGVLKKQIEDSQVSARRHIMQLKVKMGDAPSPEVRHFERKLERLSERVMEAENCGSLELILRDCCEIIRDIGDTMRDVPKAA